MMHTATTALLWFAALGSGLIGGLYFAFSAFAMRALGSLDADSGASAMNAINRDILRSLFLPLFWTTSLTALVLAVAALMSGWVAPGAASMFAGGALYVLGMFVCTVVFNVPLNNALASATPQDMPAVWRRYLVAWTRWNHVRTVACMASCALFVHALVARG